MLKNGLDNLKVLFVRDIFLILGLILCFPMYFSNAIKYSVPMGAAGLFTQMASQIADANFQLPLESPFYGPGGVPFAYPPVGLYLLAIFIKLTGKYLIFLRFIPALLSLLSLIPLYYITLEISKSRIAALSAIIIATSSIDLYIAHVWSAGIVRALAFLFSLISICFFYQTISNKRSKLNTVMTGIFFGLALMTHLEYALFCFLWIWWHSIFSRNIIFRIKDSLIFSGIGTLIASIWLVPIFLRYSGEVFFNAFGSHGGEGLFSIWNNLGEVIGLFIHHLEPIQVNNVLSFLVLIGVIYLVVKKEYPFLFFFVFIIVAFPEGARYIFLVGSIVTGIALFFIVDTIFKKLPINLKTIFTTITLLAVLGSFLWQGYKTFSRQSPRLDSATFELADIVQVLTKPNAKYLALLTQVEAEWLPFLFQREPVASLWGSEWLGTYDEQAYLMSQFSSCQRKEDWLCVQNNFMHLKNYPDFVITYRKDEKLNLQIVSTNLWHVVYENEHYVLWQK